VEQGRAKPEKTMLQKWLKISKNKAWGVACRSKTNKCLFSVEKIIDSFPLLQLLYNQNSKPAENLILPHFRV